MNFELEARWINDFKNMLDKDERVIRHLVIKRDEAITEDCPPPPEFQTLQGGMDNHDEEDGVDYDDDEAYDEDWEAEAEVVYDDEAEGSVISLHGYKEDDDGNNEVRHSKFASASNTRKKVDTWGRWRLVYFTFDFQVVKHLEQFHVLFSPMISVSQLSESNPFLNECMDPFYCFA